MSGFNGMQPNPPSPPAQYAPATVDAPLAIIQPIAITPSVLKWVIGTIASVMMFLAASPVAERYLNPAKQSDLAAVQAIVEVLKQGQETMKAAQHEQRAALERLTLAVDNLSGVVAMVQTTVSSAPSRLPLRVPPVVRPR